MRITVVGSVALDTVETPSGRNDNGLGGAAVYFSIAAKHFCDVHLVGVIGDDFPEEHVTLLGDKGIDLTGLERVDGGKTFRWSGKYHEDVNDRDTLETQLNVLETFDPKVPDHAKDADVLFLANMVPALQLKVLEQTKPKIVGLDTMNLWIDIARDELYDVLRRVDIFILNDAEAKQLTDRNDLVTAADDIHKLGPRYVVIKKGEHGCLMFGPDGQMFAAPAMPLRNVVDPTGAGDSFAGGFMGYLATHPERDFDAMRRAVIYGSTLASFTCEAFGPDRLSAIERAHLDERYERFRQLTLF